MTPMALAQYRLRPVPWGWLTMLAAAWLLGTRLVIDLPRDPGICVVAFRWTALLLGLGAVILLVIPPRPTARDRPTLVRQHDGIEQGEHH